MEWNYTLGAARTAVTSIDKQCGFISIGPTDYNITLQDCFFFCNIATKSIL